MKIKTTVAASIETDSQYHEFERLIRERVAGIDGSVFEVDVEYGVLFRTYLHNLPSNVGHYNCNCCKAFIEKYGKVVRIDDQGRTTSVLFCDPDLVPEFFRVAAVQMKKVVESARVKGVFLWGEKERTWGTPTSNGWTHFSGVPIRPPFKHVTLTPGQSAAEKKQDYITLTRALNDYPESAARQALRVLESDTVYRAEKALGVAKWFCGLHESLEGKGRIQRNNLVWKAVADAPPGFAHVRSTMISTLLDDIVAGLPFEDIAAKWKAKMHPLQYQRPTAPPTDGAIKQAEELFEKMGAAASLKRRFATLDDVLAKLWTPRLVQEKATEGGGLFGHLKQKSEGVREVELPAVAITAEKFRWEVLPEALTMEVLAPYIGNYYALVTAVDPEAPPLFQWDGLEGQQRNPVSSYVYVSGSTASQWNLTAGWVPVTAVFLGPHHWQQPEKFSHMGTQLMFALKGCWEKSSSSLALFPECLRSELHGVRKVIEAHSRSGRIEGGELGNANGIAFSKNSPVTVRVRTAKGQASYKIDRWD